jgi:hypothetical protein
VDTIRAFTQALWYRVTQDDDLEVIMDKTPELYLVWAQKDAPMPYLVHRIDDNALDPWVMRSGTYHIDLWDYDQTATTVYAMRKRVIGLLDRAVIGYTDPNQGFFVTQPFAGEPIPILIAARLYLGNSGFIPEDTENIWHYAMTFNMRFTRSIQEIEEILES